jgi:hypothetical protein
VIGVGVCRQLTVEAARHVLGGNGPRRGFARACCNLLGRSGAGDEGKQHGAGQLQPHPASAAEPLPVAPSRTERTWISPGPPQSPVVIVS